MVPGYHAIHGKKCDLEDLIQLIKQFSVDNWLLHLSRLATLLAGSRHRPGSEYADAFFKYIVPKKLTDKFASWFSDASRRGNRAFIFSDRHVGILIELAIRHAPSEEKKEMGPGGSLLNALLMLVDLDTPPKIPTTMEEWAPVMASLWDRSRLVDPMSTTVRGFHLYQIACREPTTSAQKWADLFKRATGAELERFFLGGLVAFAIEFLKQPDEIARVFSSLPDRIKDDEGKLLAGVPDSYYGLKCGTVQQLASTVARLEDHANPNEFNLVPILKYPLFRDKKGGAHSLFLSGIATSLCEGIYQEVITASLDRKISESRQDTGAVFGFLFEKYVLDLLEEVFGERLLRKPIRSDNGNEAADGAIIYPQGVIILQIKGRHVRAKDRFAWKDPKAKSEDVERTGLVEAVKQFVDKESLSIFRRGLVKELPFTLSSETVLQPIVITYEAVPLAGLQLPIVKKQRARVKLDSHTRPLVIMDVREIEAACSLPQRDTFWGVLTEFINSLGWRERYLTNFLYDTQRLSDSAMLARWERMLPLLKERFGIIA